MVRSRNIPRPRPTVPAGVPRIILPVILLAMILAGCRDESSPIIMELATPPSPPAGLATAPRDSLYRFMLDSYRKVGNLHTITLCGDFQAQMAVEHWGIMMELDRREAGKATRDQRRTGCSMFQQRGADGHRLVGRNFDHKDSEMLAAWCFPDSGFASLGFVPLNQWGFTPRNPFDPENPRHRRMLLKAPLAVIEGMNERGVCVTLASLGAQEVNPGPAKEPRFLIHLVREILDGAADLEQAIALADEYNVFDNGRDLISHHIFLADPDHGSAVLEWHAGRMSVLRSGESPQAVTNTPVWGQDPTALGRACPRYAGLWQRMKEGQGLADWRAGMDALARVVQRDRRYVINGENWRVSTRWSAVFDLTERQAHLCLERDFGTVYQLRAPVR